MHRPSSALLIPLAAVAGLALGVLGAGSATAEPDLDAELERVVDLPGARARREAALALAAREDVTLAALVKAMRAFGPKESVETGVHVHDLPLAPGEGGRRVAHTPVYVPPGYDPAKPAPLMLALHGAGSRGAEMIPWWREVADELGMLVAAPTEAGSNKGYRASAKEREDVLQVLRWLRRRYAIDTNRVHLTGISRGAHLTWDLGVRHPDRWASLSPMVGGPRLHLARGQNNIRYVENAVHLPIRDLQGRGDDSRLIFNLTLAFEKLQKAGAEDARLLLQEGYDHGFDFDAVDWKAFLGGAVRDPLSKDVVRLAARPGEGRAHWVEILTTKSPVSEEIPLKVTAAKWNRLDDAGRRRYMQKEADKRTARLEARYIEKGRFSVKETGVKRFRLLLSSEMFDPGVKVEVRVNGRRLRRQVKPSKETLLLEFVERVDPAFLPLAEVRIP